jgi:hypothetical protein
VLVYLDLQRLRLVSPQAFSALAPALEHCLLSPSQQEETA